MLFMMVGAAQSMEAQQMLQRITRSRSSQHSSASSNRGHTVHDKDSKFFCARLGVSHEDFEKSRHLQW